MEGTWEYLPLDTQRIILHNLYIDDERRDVCQCRLVNSQFRDELENVQMPRTRRTISTEEEWIELQIVIIKNEDALISTLRWLKTKGTLPQVMPYIGSIARRGFVRALQWIRQQGIKGFGPHVMDEAAQAGRLNTVKWLHENIKEEGEGGCTKNAMILAAHLGHLEVVKWLHENRNEGCGEILTSLACDAIQLEVMQYLYEHRRDEIGSVEDALQAWKDVHKLPNYWHRRSLLRFVESNAVKYYDTCTDVYRWLVRCALEDSRQGIRT